MNLLAINPIYIWALILFFIFLIFINICIYCYDCCCKCCICNKCKSRHNDIVLIKDYGYI